MRWFGPRWDAPVCEEGEEVQTPLGEPCGDCAVPINLGDRGLLLAMYKPYAAHEGPIDWPVHLDCLLKSVTGP